MTRDRKYKIPDEETRKRELAQICASNRISNSY